MLLAGTGCARGGDNPGPTAATFAESTVGNDDGDSDPDTTTDDGDDSGDDSPPDDTAGDDDTSSTGATPVDPPDLSDGSWQFQNVSMTVGISLHARRAVLDDGREVVSWAQSNPDAISNVNIMTADGPGEWAVSSITAFDDVQNTFPSMAGGNRALVAWAGKTGPDDSLDIWLVRSQGASWSPPENISTMFEDAKAPLSDTEPVLLRRPDGGVAVVYLASLVDKFLPPGPPEVFVSKFFEDNSPSQRLALNPANAFCNSLSGATAPSGVFHVVLACTDSGDSTLVHATDRSGEWDTDPLNGVTAGVLSPNMSRGPEVAHLVWIQDAPCGKEGCSEVFYMPTDTDEVFGTPVQVTNTANRNERIPAVGVDPWGRVLTVFQARVDGVARLYSSFSEDGQTFDESERISPDGDDDYQTPHAITFDDAGYPSFVHEVALDGSDPLNIEIFVARFVPN